MDWTRWTSRPASTFNLFIKYRCSLKRAPQGTHLRDSVEDLIAILSVAAATVRQTPGIFSRVFQSLTRPFHSCIDIGGGRFDHLQ
ncbi:hypothetical protein AVEN_121794-1 [Araneus ventricosus]|uniref:Uncharacterized protein n=1 Tax=Araneus ventricosus TaxID=182803 RepID=A0A4Y2I8N6_ARAVE|nr:hypothetical protein AVEN_121794-1 [Araneus ventricosus]